MKCFSRNFLDILMNNMIYTERYEVYDGMILVIVGLNKLKNHQTSYESESEGFFLL